MKPRLHAWSMSVLALAVFLPAKPAASAEPAEDGRQAYAANCFRCHGQIEQSHALWPESVRPVPVVMAPQGPNLTGMYGRPAGSIPGFRYSNAFRVAAAKGMVWDAATLDRWLTDSQAMIRGSYMFLKLPEPQRGQVIRYLEAYSRSRR